MVLLAVAAASRRGGLGRLHALSSNGSRFDERPPRRQQRRLESGKGCERPTGAVAGTACLTIPAALEMAAGVGTAVATGERRER